MSQPKTAADGGSADEPGYDGPARLVGDGRDIRVHVTLRGVFQPIDGKYHWYGRLDASEEVAEMARSRSLVVLQTQHGEAQGRLSDQDPWGRYRISGTGNPPFDI